MLACSAGSGEEVELTSLWSCDVEENIVVWRLICGRPQSSAPQNPGRVSVRLQWSDGELSGRAKTSLMVQRLIAWAHISKAARATTSALHNQQNPTDHDCTKLHLL